MFDSAHALNLRRPVAPASYLSRSRNRRMVGAAIRPPDDADLAFAPYVRRMAQRGTARGTISPTTAVASSLFIETTQITADLISLRSPRRGGRCRRLLGRRATAADSKHSLTEQLIPMFALLLRFVEGRWRQPDVHLRIGGGLHVHAWMLRHRLAFVGVGHGAGEGHEPALADGDTAQVAVARAKATHCCTPRIDSGRTSRPSAAS